ncbi:MFS transporter [Ancylomarina euxinus]|uniref:MFS transporter n=1 Tax=Ancylomarina euxinus TaxID=2283627 RepID=A0A425Y5C1_9BACT|nr:peptide MFS transporter [Ancylomarina euxinus]MCZ4694269.1 peptide MFS transporter [Ancylomarina euxinus]MUP14399.1 MFS transporter [Ancylomarina euxinus]RRG23708.1 MFS transporter [Ancylomarina euxinus]
MFKGHPKGLIPAALANMGERFGFYTMMAILVLFLQAKFGLDETSSGIIYSTFYASIYFLAIVGGLIADKTKNYKGTILAGLLMMAFGYLLLAIPTPTPVPSLTLYLTATCVGLAVIAFGNGLFKGNLQALVGQMYDNPKYDKVRDSGFSLFYMFINVGGIFAPMIAPSIRSWWLERAGYNYNATLPELCHQHLGGTLSETAAERFTTLANNATISTDAITDFTAFSNDYLNVFNEGFHYAFGVAILAMLISLVIYLKNKVNFPDPALKAAQAKADNTVVEMDVKEVKQRIYALLAVFGVVIFFWFSFHQNGYSLTYFARDYTLLKLGSWDLTPEIFQSMNPFFVVFLTPIVVGIFGWLRNRGIEPSTPKKIAIGMFIAALGFVVMALGSTDLPLLSAVKEMGGLPELEKVTPFLLIGTYFVLTVAELFISPLGISFVSKVAPPHLQGLMQGLWLGATGLGNQLLIFGGLLYAGVPIWLTWTVFVIACSISMIIMLVMVKWLERVSQ